MKIEILLRNRVDSMFLETDSNQFILHDGNFETISKEGETKQNKKNAKFYSNLKTAIEGILTYGLLKSEANSLKELRIDLIFLKEQINKLY